jgi:hypothetical protein
MTLSDEIQVLRLIEEDIYYLREDKVKEFIKELNEVLDEIERGNVFEEWLEHEDRRDNLHKFFCRKVREGIDKLAGEKLI